ncbi:MAG: hypothetical protein WD969_01335, partial [Paracoccaceae bacterium]
AYCVGGDKPKLFLPAEKGDRVVTLIASGGSRAEMLWPAGAGLMDWPAAAPFTAGAAFSVMIGDVEMPGGFTLQPAPKGATPAARLSDLLKEGCLAQAEASLAELEGKG